MSQPLTPPQTHVQTQRPASPTSPSHLEHEADKPIDEHDAAHVNQPLPHVGRPLDGSQYHDVVDEQIYAEQRPPLEPEEPEQEPSKTVP